MYRSNQTTQGGQSWTLDVTTDPKTRETVVSCAGCPDVAPVRDRDGRYAVQRMRRLLDEHTNQGHQSDRRPLMIGMGELLDD